MTNCPQCGKPVGPTDQACPSCGKGLSGKDLLAPSRAEGTPPLSILLLLASAGLAFFGLVLSSQASLGTSVIGMACLLGIWARITQASKHHRELMRR